MLFIAAFYYATPRHFGDQNDFERQKFRYPRGDFHVSLTLFKTFSHLSRRAGNKELFPCDVRDIFVQMTTGS